jgi:transcriptional regulator with XRE-family HTH domain
VQLLYHQWLRSGGIGKKRRTQADFARLIGTGQQTVQPWVAEKGKQVTPDGDSLANIAEALGINGHWLLTGDGSRAAPGVAEIEPYRQARDEVEAELRQRVLRAVTAALLPTDEVSGRREEIRQIEKSFEQVAPILGRPPKAS